jgi:hypothetical protein
VYNVLHYSLIVVFISYSINLPWMVEALHYKPEDRGFDSRWGKLFFFPYTVPPRFTQSVREMSNVRVLGVKSGRACKADNRHPWADCMDNVRSSISHNPIGGTTLLFMCCIHCV